MTMNKSNLKARLVKGAGYFWHPETVRKNASRLESGGYNANPKYRLDGLYNTYTFVTSELDFYEARRVCKVWVMFPAPRKSRKQYSVLCLSEYPYHTSVTLARADAQAWARTPGKLAAWLESKGQEVPTHD